MNELIVLPPSKPEPELDKTLDLKPSEPARTPFWKKVAAPAGALALLLGVGVAVADRVMDAHRGASAEMIAARAASDSAAEALRAAQTQRQENADLRGHVEGLKSKLEAQAQKSRANEATIGALQKTLDEQRAAAAATTSQLQAKLEKVQTLATEKQIDHTPMAATAAIAPKPPVKPLPRPAQPGMAGPGMAEPGMAQGPMGQPVYVRTPSTPLRAFVLRDVEGGRAVVEGPRGLEEVGPGDILPGGARVERIERRGPNWIVLTDRGAINPDGRWD